MTNQNQPSEVKEGGALDLDALEASLAIEIEGAGRQSDSTPFERFVAKALTSDDAKSKGLVDKVWVVSLPDARKAIAAISEWNAARPPSVERGEAEGWRPEVRGFADLMEAQLRANDHKPGWKGHTWGALLTRLREEADQLCSDLNYASFYDTGDRGARQLPDRAAITRKRAAHVANFAMMIADVCGALPAAPSPAPSADPDEIKAAYQQGWSDREADIIERAERILPAPSAVEMAGVDRVALARAMFDAANDDLGNILVLGCGEHNYSDPEDAAWATALLMADSAILALATASREKGSSAALNEVQSNG